MVKGVEFGASPGTWVLGFLSFLFCVFPTFYRRNHKVFYLIDCSFQGYTALVDWWFCSDWPPLPHIEKSLWQIWPFPPNLPKNDRNKHQTYFDHDIWKAHSKRIFKDFLNKILFYWIEEKIVIDFPFKCLNGNWKWIFYAKVQHFSFCHTFFILALGFDLNIFRLLLQFFSYFIFCGFEKKHIFYGIDLAFVVDDFNAHSINFQFVIDFVDI
jgi:hypothetical protein